MTAPLVGVVMGSDSDWTVMQHAVARLEEFGVPYESRVVSAHRTPDLLFEYATEAAARGLRCIIAGAGGSAHLPGMLASKTWPLVQRRRSSLPLSRTLSTAAKWTSERSTSKSAKSV